MHANAQAARDAIARAPWPHIGLIGGIAAAVVFVAFDLIDASLRPGYSVLRHWVSHRALGEFGWIGTASLLATALLLLICAAALFAVARRSSRRSGYPSTVGLAGLALAIAALFPMDPSLGYPPGATASDAPTLSGSIHDVAGPVLILALATAAFLGRGFLRTLDIQAAWARHGWVVGVGIVAAFAVTSILVSLDYAQVLSGAWSGLCERIAIYLGLGWIAGIAWQVDRAQSRGMSTR